MDSSPSQDIYIPKQWSEAVEYISCSSTPIVFICGAKNCGKTTFSRYLLNILLHKYTKVAYLDTDVGQPAFTPPAFLSLTIVHKVTPGWFLIPCLNLCRKTYFTIYFKIIHFFIYFRFDSSMPENTREVCAISSQ